MDILEALKKLARLAREEEPPKTDVSAHVLMQIREEDEPVTAPLWVLAASSAAAAAAVAGIAAYTWVSWNDPLIGFFSPFHMVML